MKTIQEIENAPKAIGPYSPIVMTDNFAFLSGQIPIDPNTSKLVEGDITAQTTQVFKNIKAVLKAVNLTLNNVVKTTVFMKDLNDFQSMNAIYAENFGEHKPARSTIQVAKLPMDAMVEIEVVAISEK